MGTDAAVKYGWTEALIAARDRLTPPFAHRHTYDEVAEWYRSGSYDRLEFLRDEPLPGGFPDDLVNLRVSVGIRGFKHTAASRVMEIGTDPRFARGAPHSA